MGEYNHEQNIKKLLYTAGAMVVFTLILILIQL